MDRSPIREALEKAKLIISSHGMVRHMPSYVKSSLANLVADSAERVSYEFYLYPKKTGYSPGNYNCALSVWYSSGQDVEREGGVYRDYAPLVMVRIGSAELSYAELQLRENMISSLAMLAELLETALPQKITLTVMTPEVLKQKKQSEHEQLVASQIFDVVGKESVSNLRKGGRPKLTRIPDRYSEVYRSMPEPGHYRFSHARRYDRYGHVKDRAEFVFVVVDPRTLKAYRVG
ncbi:MAG: hypothetical protein FJZ60_00085 [Chlamydiae bacterium]|nr:hypothetical protein [Chlamydiota bacterium]